MATKKQTHTSSRKKASAPTKKAAAKASKSSARSKLGKKKQEQERLKKRIQLTLRAFRMAYEANQRGEFQRLK